MKKSFISGIFIAVVCFLSLIFLKGFITLGCFSDEIFDIDFTGYEFLTPTEIRVYVKANIFDFPEEYWNSYSFKNRVLNLAYSEYQKEVKPYLKREFFLRQCWNSLYKDKWMCMRVGKWEKENFYNWEVNITPYYILFQDKKHIINDYFSLRKGNIKNAFKNTKAFDLCFHHNQTLDVVSQAERDGFISKNYEKGYILLHFDTHSDFYAEENPENFSESIANYVNTLLVDYPIKEMYWVLPDWTKRKEVNHVFWDFPEQAFDTGGAFVFGENHFVLYVGENRWIYYEEPSDFSEVEYKTVDLYRVLAKDLPDFSGKDMIILDIDEDYFGNTGHDTTGDAAYNYSETELSLKLNDFFNVILKKNIKPLIVAVARSPFYTPSEDIPGIESFFKNIMATTGKRDYIIGYEHELD